MDITAVRFDGLSRNGEAQPESCPIGAAAFPKRLERVSRAVGNATALVLHLDHHVLMFMVHPEHDAAPCVRVLERVVQQVRHRRREQLRIRVHGQVAIDTLDQETNVAVLSVKIGDDRYLVDEFRHSQPLAPLYTGAKPDVGQRAVDEVAESHQAPAEHHSRAAVDGEGSMFQRLKREKRCIEQVAKFVRHLPPPLSLLCPGSLRCEAGVLCHRSGDGRVEAAIQRVEFFDGNRRILCSRASSVIAWHMSP